MPFVGILRLLRAAAQDKYDTNITFMNMDEASRIHLQARWEFMFSYIDYYILKCYSKYDEEDVM